MVPFEGVIFSNDAAPAGTGLINSFVRISSNDPEIEGYNTSDRPLEFDENNSPQFTRDLLFEDIPQVMIDDIVYLEFQLDINESNDGTNNYLSLDEIEIYISDSQIVAGTYDGIDFGGSATKVYELDSDGDDNWIALDFDLQAGSGVNDMVMFVPLSFFEDAGVEDDDFVTLYSLFGLQDASTDGDITYEWDQSDGFEEWDVRQFASFRGVKYEDEFGNIINDGDPLLEGWEIRAYVDLNEDGDLDHDEYLAGPVAVDVTDEFGAYRLDLFPEIDGVDIQYLIVEVLQGDWNQVFPIGDNILDDFLVTVTTEGGTEIELLGPKGYVFDPGNNDLDDPILGNDFGNFLPFDISGIKFEDDDADGVLDGGEDAPSIEFSIRLSIWEDGSGGQPMDGMVQVGELFFVNQVGSDLVTGFWEFTDLDSLPEHQKYFVNEAPETGWTQSTPDPSVNLGGIIIDNEQSGVNITGLEFGNFRPADVHGTKYEDVDFSGDLTSGDVVLSGVTITLTGTDGMGDSVTLTTTTDVDGDYWFTGLNPGSYTVTETVPGGSEASSATAIGVDLDSGDVVEDVDFFNFVPAQIHGTKYEDVDFSGDLTSGDVVLSGVTITLTGTDGMGDSVTLTTTTDVDGDYWFTGLNPGSYTVTETVPGGSEPSSATAIGVDLDSGDVVEDVDFFNFVPAQIHGTKYEDVDFSGDLTSGDVVLSGVTITLTGTDGMGDSVTLTTTTDVDGDYWFTGLNPGSYTVTETVPGGSEPSSATAIGVDLDSGDVVNNVDFFNFVPPEIHGTKYEDVDFSGDLTSGDVVLSGVTITLTGTDGMGDSVTLTTTTDVDGDYWFTGLNPGSYTVTETVPGGSEPSSATAIGVDLDSGDVVNNVDFFNFVPPEIHGTKYEDVDFSGDLTSGDVVLSGVTITLTGTDGMGDSVTLTTTTDVDGDYWFTGLNPGSYRAAIRSRRRFRVARSHHRLPRSMSICPRETMRRMSTSSTSCHRRSTAPSMTTRTAAAI